MSVTHAQHHTDDTRAVRDTAGPRRGELDRDLVAVLGMLVILLLTGLCFVGQGVLPL